MSGKVGLWFLQASLKWHSHITRTQSLRHHLPRHPGNGFEVFAAKFGRVNDAKPSNSETPMKCTNATSVHHLEDKTTTKTVRHTQPLQLLPQQSLYILGCETKILRGGYCILQSRPNQMWAERSLPEPWDREWQFAMWSAALLDQRRIVVGARSSVRRETFAVIQIDLSTFTWKVMVELNRAFSTDDTFLVRDGLVWLHGERGVHCWEKTTWNPRPDRVAEMKHPSPVKTTTFQGTPFMVGATYGYSASVAARWEGKRWIDLPKMNVPRRKHCLIEHKGCVYAIGGTVQGGIATAAVERYDPQRDVWERMPSLTVARNRCSAVVWEGELLVFGGFGEDYAWHTAERFVDDVNWELAEDLQLPAGNTYVFPFVCPPINMHRKSSVCAIS